MNSKLIIHSKYAINYAKFLNHSKSLPQFCNKGEQYFQHHNSYLIPYHCKSVNNKTNLIIGNFIYPMPQATCGMPKATCGMPKATCGMPQATCGMWNTLESILLNKETVFNYNYIMGDKFTIEMTPTYLKNYHILNEAHVTVDNSDCHRSPSDCHRSPSDCHRSPSDCQKKYRMYPNRIYACDTTLEPNSILLFPIHKDVADILIQTKLL
jgi:hypothetical protein